jgi:hypothetical protein
MKFLLSLGEHLSSRRSQLAESIGKDYWEVNGSRAVNDTYTSLTWLTFSIVAKTPRDQAHKEKSSAA